MVDNSRGHRSIAVAGFAVISAYLLFLAWLTSRFSYDDWAGFFLAPLLLIVGLTILHRLLPKVETDSTIRTIIYLGFAAKIVGSFARFYMNKLVLGRGDSTQYYEVGGLIASEFRNFVFGGPAYDYWIPEVSGTAFIRLITAVVFTFTGTSHLGGYVTFSFISFWGLYFFYRAFCLAVPDGLRHRYAAMVFFLPSMVFWPSSIGKEACMITLLGIGTYGFARLLTRERHAYLLLALALVGTGLIRPHVSAIFGLAVVCGFILRRDAGGGGAKKLIGLLVFAATAGILMNRLQTFFDLDAGLDTTAVFAETNERSSQGGSEFAAVQPTSPAQLPWAIVTVIFRPFLFEAGGGAGLVTALEGTVLLILFGWNAPRLVRLPALMLARPYVAYAAVYTVIFSFAFAAIANFGILARQRTQLFPIVTTILALPIDSSVRTRNDLKFAIGEHRNKSIGGNAADRQPSPAGANRLVTVVPLRDLTRGGP